jgi:hypothetical protein
VHWKKNILQLVLLQIFLKMLLLDVLLKWKVSIAIFCVTIIRYFNVFIWSIHLNWNDCFIISVWSLLYMMSQVIILPFCIKKQVKIYFLVFMYVLQYNYKNDLFMIAVLIKMILFFQKWVKCEYVSIGSLKNFLTLIF